MKEKLIEEVELENVFKEILSNNKEVLSEKGKNCKENIDLEKHFKAISLIK